MEVSRAQLAAYVLAAFLVLFAGYQLLRGRGGGEKAPPVAIDGTPQGGSASTAPAGPGAGRPAGGGEVFVSVAGAVRHPGLHSVPPGSRVAAAIDRAGGFTRRADLTGVNLAAKVADGQQVIVPKRGEAAAAAPGGNGAGAGDPTAGAGPGGAPAGGSISLSTASQQQLETLEGIGPALAMRIIEFREKNGGFRSIEQLKDVSGIGEKRFEALRDSVRP